ncbi:TIGR03620 family F420-dependent LLM class oxidoreductase [Saccharopolyspora shandongensis]|uniref:TIGR03620 family F420-dependent LLM class oxidoreductase n=1 Tax=Saccharopolyspora shandongensis TaxID=418495 RepID=UPI0033FAC49C
MGVHYVEGDLTPEAAAKVERLGYTAVWIAGTREPRLTIVERVLAATGALAVATGIVNIWYAEAQAVADTYHRLEAAYPGRFLLGIGAGHRELGTDFRSPYQALVDYLDVLDESGVPKQRRVLAALGPRVLKLAAERSAGAHPFLVTPEYTRRARELVGPDALLAVRLEVVHCGVEAASPNRAPARRH